jgi:Tfp pilus assembly protein PilF
VIGVLLLVGALQQDPGHAHAESLLAAHDLPRARAAAERLVRAHPQDARAHLILGRVWLAWPIVGRYTAYAEFRRAAELAPRDPEPLYGQIQVGTYLKSDEGEGIARRALLKILTLAPDYRDCWTLFEHMYHNEDIWRQADAALAHHPDDPAALEHRAEIALALEQPAQADSFAGLLLAHRPGFVPSLQLRAAAAFAAGRDSTGYAWYDAALARADLDSTGALWEQVWMIASPAEIARERSTPPGARRQFLQRFWERRDPNLVTPYNERIAEHFRRLEYVRHMFHLLHPFATYHFSPARRALFASFERDSLSAWASELAGLFSTLSTSKLLAQHRVGPDVRDANDTMGPRTESSLANLDARGLLWIRHGPPDVALNGVPDPCRPTEPRPGLDLEGWLYHTSEGTLCIALHRVGDFILTPVNGRQARSARLLMTSDATTLPATLSAIGWSAFFKSAEPGSTDFYVRTQPETAAVALWDMASGERVARVSGAGLLRVSALPGLYDLGLDVESAGSQARIRQPVRLPGYSWAILGLSSLILAPADSLLDRRAALAEMPADMAYPAGRSLATYAEVYGLSRDARGLAHYRVHYTFVPLRGLLPRLFGASSPVEFEFDREAAWQPALPERLVIEPGRLAPGRYRVTLAVTDLPSNVKSETIAIEITVR